MPKAAIDEQHRVVVRLQGIDAPELHYRALCLVPPAERTATQTTAFSSASGDYRQPLGETATLALRAFLGIPMREDDVDLDNEIPCILRSRIDEPNEAFDTYGRLVADVFVNKDGAQVSLNHWLAKSGCAVPALYAWMSAEERALEQGLAAARHRTLDEFVHGQGVLELRPVDLVFQEAASRLVREGRAVVGW